jgi:hypothetical protein
MRADPDKPSGRHFEEINRRLTTATKKRRVICVEHGELASRRNISHRQQRRSAASTQER